MLKNYFKIASRTILRQKGFSLINVAGLATGLACCIIIWMYVYDEIGYDRFHAKADQIHRVALKRLYPNRETSYAITPVPVGSALKTEFPEVLSSTRIWKPGRGELQISFAEKQFRERAFLFADSNFFDIFSIPLIGGNPKTALREPDHVVLTQTTAQKYFGDQDPLGKILKTDFSDFTVSGVCEDVPENSHFTFNMLGSFSSIGMSRSDNWISFAVHNYVVLQPGALVKELEAKIPAVVEKYAGPQIHARLNTSFADYRAAGNGYDYYLQPITDIHLKSHLESELRPNGDVTYVYASAMISILILLIACSNFMNLATARSANRAKEVGVRKALGSEKRQLVGQFLFESIFMSVLAVALALVLVYFALPWFNESTGFNIRGVIFENTFWLAGLFGFAVLVGLAAGAYPAFFLSNFKPIVVLKSKIKGGAQNAFFRNTLVIFQFAASFALLVGTMIVQRQVDFMQNARMGFDKEQVLLINNAFRLDDKREAFKTALESHINIIDVTAARNLPGSENFPGEMYQPEENPSLTLTTRMMVVDDNFFETMKMEIVEGRSFSKDFPTDSLAVILNETAVKGLGLEAPIGKRIFEPENQKTYTIVGVVKDFHYQSLHHNISPLVLHRTGSAVGGFVSFLPIRMQAENVQETLAFIGKTWREFAPDHEMEFAFMDANFEAFYQAEQRTGRLFLIFSGLAIFVACLGLLGLAAFMAQQRTKEIGVRKTLGASVANVVLLLSKDFTRLMAVAFVIAAPVAYFVMSEWLANFAYRIDVSALVFVLAGAIILAVAWLTTSYQSIKAAMTNPVDALKYE